MKRPPRRKREPRCACGSGKLRRTCDPAHVVVPCIGVRDPETGEVVVECDRLFHLTSNVAKRCPVCRPIQERVKDAAKHRRNRAKAKQRAAEPAEAAAP